MRGIYYDWKILENEVYLYDGTFNGLLTIAFDCYIQQVIPSKIVPELEYETSLLEQCSYIPTDGEKSQTHLEWALTKMYPTKFFMIAISFSILFSTKRSCHFKIYFKWIFHWRKN